MGRNVVVVLQGGVTVQGAAIERIGDLASLRGRTVQLVNVTVSDAQRVQRLDRITVDGSSVIALGAAGG